MAEPTERDRELANRVAERYEYTRPRLYYKEPPLHEGIAKAVAQAREEGRRDVLRYIATQAEIPDWRDEVRVALRYVIEGVKKGFGLESKDA